MSSDQELNPETSQRVNDLMSGAFDAPLDSEDDINRSTSAHRHDAMVSDGEEESDLGIMQDATFSSDDDLGVSKANPATPGVSTIQEEPDHDHSEEEAPREEEEEEKKPGRISPRTTQRVRDFTPRESYSYAEVDALVSGVFSDRLRVRYRCLMDLSGVARTRKWKSVVGNRLGRKGIAIIFRELSHEDRGVRTAAARLLTDLAYECQDNQQIIAFHTGHDIDGVRVFAISDELRRKNTRPGQEDMQSVLEDLYRVYPDSKNPRFWCYPPFSSDLVNLFPDPLHHFIGFPLAPVDSDTENQNTQALSARRPQSGPFVRQSSPLAAGANRGGGDLPPHPRTSRRPASAVPQAAQANEEDEVPTPRRKPKKGGRPQSARAVMDGPDARKKRPASGAKKVSVFSRLSSSAKSRPQSARSAKSGTGNGTGAKPASARKKRPSTARATGVPKATAGSGSTSAPSSRASTPQPPRRPQTAAAGAGAGGRRRPVRPATAAAGNGGGNGGGAKRPKSAPAFRKLVRKATAVNRAAKPPARSQLTKAFWESIELATQTSANSINVHATLNMQLHPAVATYKWSSKSAQQRILHACSETADSKGNFSAIDRRQQSATASRNKSAQPWQRPGTAGSRPATAGRLSKTLNTQSLATPTAAERRQFAVDIYSSPFTGGAGATDPSRTMLDFQSMLIRTEAQPKKTGPARIRKTDTVVGLPVPGASMSSGSFTLDKMALREMRKLEREAKANGGRGR